ncbi:histidine phosphatase family protein [Streptomyces sp. NPDC058330]|uniref:histidine phosphatase family protein n=1 Tax=Streptomyces sp. NPDC058330 TaxID=3346449 RepID=UPI0036E3E3F6
MARALRARIPAEADVQLFSSDLRRTRRTAEDVAELFGVRPVLDPRLREKSYGEAGGRPQEWLDRRFVPGCRLTWHRPPDSAPRTAVGRSRRPLGSPPVEQGRQGGAAQLARPERHGPPWRATSGSSS